MGGGGGESVRRFCCWAVVLMRVMSVIKKLILRVIKFIWHLGDHKCRYCGEPITSNNEPWIRCGKANLHKQRVPLMMNELRFCEKLVLRLKQAADKEVVAEDWEKVYFDAEKGNSNET